MSAARRILHLSDVHFGPKHEPAAAAAIERSVATERPDLVVISGDLTQRAKPAQFREARAFVDRLRATAPVLAVPGNHDVPLWRVWERLFAPFGAYRRHFDRELEPVFLDEALVVVGVNSAQAFAFKGGRFRRRRLGEAEAIFDAAAPAQFRILVFHHHLARPDGVDCEHPAWGAAAASRRLAGRVDLVLSGHLHRTLELRPAGAGSFAALHTGTSSSSRGREPEAGRCTLQWIEVESGRVAARREIFDSGRGSYVPLSESSWPRRER